jgi:hypothetical protein
MRKKRSEKMVFRAAGFVGSAAVRQEMNRFCTAPRPPADHMKRVTPPCPGCSVSQESANVAWQR